MAARGRRPRALHRAETGSDLKCLGIRPRTPRLVAGVPDAQSLRGFSSYPRGAQKSQKTGAARRCTAPVCYQQDAVKDDCYQLSYRSTRPVRARRLRQTTSVAAPTVASSQLEGSGVGYSRTRIANSSGPSPQTGFSGVPTHSSPL